MARVILCPPRLSDAAAVWHLGRLSPGDLQLRFEEVWFTAVDERTGERLKLAGWWIPHETAGGRCIVLLHGYGDAKVGALSWAPTLHGLGWNILVIDLRAHGQSEGRFCTGGAAEVEDVVQVMNQLRAQRPRDTRTLVLFGVDLGAAVACGVAAREGAVAGVVADSLYADYAEYHQGAAGQCRV